MEPGENPAARKLDAETPVKDVMAMMSGGVTEMMVQENGRNLGLIRTAGLMAKLLNPRGN
jgi:signal-transduction protein with cAMP-binding, CBS, and nucleotidyltransferase domain